MKGYLKVGELLTSSLFYLDSGATEKRIRVNSNCFHTECVTFGHEPNLEFQSVS